MSDIYKQHQVAFSQVSAFVVMKGSERVATIAFKFPRDGAGRLYCYVHWIGLEMVRGHANGYGYDKRSAAAASAAGKLNADPKMEDGRSRPVANNYRGFVEALRADSGRYWDDQLRDKGFTVLQAV